MGLGIVVLAYIGVLYFGAVIVPGVGLAGHLMVQVPSNLLEWAHAPGYGILAVLITRGLQHRAWPLAYALPVAAAAAFVFGLWTEVFQGSVQGRGAAVNDLVTDAIGIGFAATLMLTGTVLNRIASICLSFRSLVRESTPSLSFVGPRTKSPSRTRSVCLQDRRNPHCPK
jgi:hypothetical protein